MELHVLMWILSGGFAGTWGLCLFFMNRADSAVMAIQTQVSNDIRETRMEIREIRAEISELKNCIKDHHARLCLIEEKK